MKLSVLRYRFRDEWARVRTKYWLDVIFVHINKTGGSSIEAALGLPFQHRTALELRSDLGEARWQKRFSFAFVRNPWDKVASHYAYRVKTNQTGLGDRHLSFDEWVRAAYGDRDPRYYDQPKMFMPQLDWIADERGEMMVHYIGRFERLHEDCATVCERIGRRAELPHLKASGQNEGRDYRTRYADDTAEIVSRRFASDIERFGYSFDQRVCVS
jgi:hypothetical protein